MPVSADPRIGSELLGYRVESLLGRGGMSVVYRASDPRLKRYVALKLMAPELASDAHFRERFLKESELAASLEQPTVVPIYDAGEVEGQLFIVMRLVEGRDLKGLLREEGTLEPARALAILSQVAEALDAAHARGLVHRDVKPSNVLLDEDEHAYLADFGLTRRLADREAFAVEARSLGTIDYVAPEQIRGEEVDGRADVYALGCLLYECLAGEPPFRRASDAAVLYAHLEAEPPALPELEEVFASALAKSPEDRYQTCGELVAAARSVLGIAEPRRARWPLAIAGVGAALVGAALLAFFLTRGDGAPTETAPRDSLVRIDPGTNEVTGTVKLGDKLTGIDVGGGYVWATSFRDKSVWRVDPQTLAVTKFAVQGTPTDLAFADTCQGEVYVATGPLEAGLATLKQGSGVQTQIQLPGGLGGEIEIASGGLGECAWVANPHRQAALRVRGQSGDALTGTALEWIAIPRPHGIFFRYATFNDIAVGEGGVWVAGDSVSRSVWRIDPATKQLVATVRLPLIPNGIAAGEGAVWITSQLDDSVSRLDPGTNRIVETIAVGSGSHGIAVGAGAVWVANSIDGTVSRIDARRNAVVAMVPLEGLIPEEVSVGAGSVWVTTRDG